MMQYGPAGVQEPSDSYETVGSQPPVGTVGDHSQEGKLPWAHLSVGWPIGVFVYTPAREN